MKSMNTPITEARPQADARLLVVEDEPNILELLSASLRYAGFDVITAAAGEVPRRWVLIRRAVEVRAAAQHVDRFACGLRFVQ